MEAEKALPDGNEAHPVRRNRKRCWWLLALVALILWVVITTERRVIGLRSQGFTDVVIDSERNHAYFPLIGGILGAAVSIALVRGMKRLLRGQPE